MDEQSLNQQAIDAIVEQVLAKMGKPTLMVLTTANGYHQEIANHLGAWTGIRWHILASQPSEGELAAVHHLGNQVHWDGANPSQWLNDYEQVLFPFLDFATLGEVSNGLYLTPAGQLFQYALMKGIPTYAFNYQCDLNSELNQLLGLSGNVAMRERATLQLEQIAKLGAKTGSLLIIKAAMLGIPEHSEPVLVSSIPSGYITLNEVKNKGVRAYTLQDNLTDLAAEYIKEQQLQ
ncbi:hypothetical protein [Photobacterium phosphoreum]|jgi:hypothetical protein|uniref:hypothetical protein n=1 Tax=Photobacterium phosphoreum TaxID=659 RepID=UPI0007F92E08|nr:hypothetical protein [Photobacterium phosphoreum]MCD9462260.1 hypothetical protein [Photobacterium phosphoreum]MCD9518603.1 hypothetical protein [Photobacterium phosphoreum]OBU37375.1 hypothetical protein AYY24_11130 [Photobacterium phosphoreum]PSW38068.1 hypothetical protein CTM87_05875 [Photobacterium phosphoreum]